MLAAAILAGGTGGGGGIGSLSPKGKPDFLPLEASQDDDDVVAGSMTYALTVSACSQDMHHSFYVMSQADSQHLMHIL